MPFIVVLISETVAVSGHFLLTYCSAAFDRTVPRSTCGCKMLATVGMSFRSLVLIYLSCVCICFLCILTFLCLLLTFIVYFLEILGGDFTRTGNPCSLCLHLSVIIVFQNFHVCVSGGMVLLRPGHKCVAPVFQDYVVSL